MFHLNDFFHLSQLEPWLQQLTQIRPGLVLVAGLDPRPGANLPETVLPSGRGAIFQVLLDEMLAQNPAVRGTYITQDRHTFRIPREITRKFTISEVQSPEAYTDHLTAARYARNKLLIVDRLTPEAAPAMLDAARQGKRVLTQLDTLFWGTGILRHLLETGTSRAQLAGLDWIVTVQRLPTLCPLCKQPAIPTDAQVEAIRKRLPTLETAGFYQALGCSHCHGTGRKGDIAAFDLFQLDPDASDPLTLPSRISLPQYVLHLAAQGLLPLEDGVEFETRQLQKVYALLTVLEQNQSQTKTTLERKLLELETANRVLEQRTEELISLENIGQALLSSTDLNALSAVVCQKALDLCHGNRAILYYYRPDGQAEVLSTGGWDPTRIQRLLNQKEVLAANPTFETKPFSQYPPGIPPRHPDLEGALLRAGIAVPLIAQDQQVGLMIVHSTKNSKFSPGDVALLQSFANHAALAIQRAGLVAQLRAKIAALEAAQAELVIKERLERELELARRVQENLLPQVFPFVPGYQFATEYRPARFVGGDFYDVIDLGEGYIGLAIADVSDKGMPAALYMTLTRSLLRAEAYRDRSPRGVLTRLNQLLIELGKTAAFVTVFYAVLDTTTCELIYARAGHDYPYLLRDDALQSLAGHGTPLGLFDASLFHISEETIHLRAGDRLVLYSDGVTDVILKDGNIAEPHRFQTLLNALHNQPPERMCATIFDRLEELQGKQEQFDDMALLIVGVK